MVRCSTATRNGNAKSPNGAARTSFRNGGGGGDTLNYSLSTNSSRKVAGASSVGAGDNKGSSRHGSASFGGHRPSYLSVPTEEERNSSPFEEEEEEEIELEMVMILNQTSQEASLKLQRDNCYQNDML